MFSPDAGFKCVICSLWKTVKPSSKCNSIHTEAGFFTKKQIKNAWAHTSLLSLFKISMTLVLVSYLKRSQTTQLRCLSFAEAGLASIYPPAISKEARQGQILVSDAPFSDHPMHCRHSLCPGSPNKVTYLHTGLLLPHPQLDFPSLPQPSNSA